MRVRAQLRFMLTWTFKMLVYKGCGVIQLLLGKDHLLKSFIQPRSTLLSTTMPYHLQTQARLPASGPTSVWRGAKNRRARLTALKQWGSRRAAGPWHTLHSEGSSRLECPASGCNCMVGGKVQVKHAFRRHLIVLLSQPKQLAASAAVTGSRLRCCLQHSLEKSLWFERKAHHLHWHDREVLAAQHQAPECM